jgi:hypothetical protein
VGLVHIVPDRDAQDRLAALRADSQQRETRLRDQLRSERKRAERLRTGLMRTRAQNTALRGELADARASAAALRQQLERTRVTLRDDPPALGVRIAALDPFAGLVAVADNPTREPVRILDSEGRLWLGDREAPLDGGLRGLSIDPEEELDFFDLGLLPSEREPVAAGQLPMRGAVCVAYARDRGEASAFAREIWFEYRPAAGDVALLRDERFELWPDEPPCDLAAAAPPW